MLQVSRPRHACVDASMHACAGACMRACMSARIRARVHVGAMHGRVHIGAAQVRDRRLTAKVWEGIALHAAGMNAVDLWQLHQFLHTCKLDTLRGRRGGPNTRSADTEMANPYGMPQAGSHASGTGAGAEAAEARAGEGGAGVGGHLLARAVAALAGDVSTALDHVSNVPGVGAEGNAVGAQLD